MKSPLLFIAFFVPILLNAHGDLHKRIKEVTEEIEKDPKNPKLYLKRGILYHQHLESKNAEKDFKKVQKYGLDNAKFHYYRAKNYLQLGKSKRALKEIQINLDRDSNDVISHQLKAEIFDHQEDFKAAAEEYEKVIQLNTKSILTDYYVAIEAYRKSEAFNQAIQLTQKAHELFPKSPNLLDLMIQLHLENEDVESAIIVLTKKILSLQRKEFDYVRRAAFHLQLGQTKKAKEDLERAKKAINQLNQRIQSTDAIKELEQRISEMEEKL